MTFFELHKLNHHLRQEAAPFTDNYYHYCYDKVENDAPKGCCDKREVHDNDFLDEDSIREGWNLTTISNRYVVKQKPWPRSTVHNGEVIRKVNKRRIPYIYTRVYATLQHQYQ